MKIELKKHLESLLDFTIDAGADECDVILSKGDSFSLSAQNGEIEKYKVSGSQVIGVRAIANSRVGISYSESLDFDSLKFAAKAAVENARNSEENPYEKITVKKGEHIISSPFKKDESLIEEKIDFCLKLESEVKKNDSRVQAVPYNGLSESTSSSYYLNSNKVFGYQDEYFLSCFTSALLKEGSENSMHYKGMIGRKLTDLNIDYCVNESLKHASQWLKGSALKTGFYDIVFTTDTFTEFLGTFSNIFSAKSAMEKTNPFAEKLNDQVANSKVTITDCPQFKDAFFQNYFDSEGNAHKDLTLIENGVLKSFYHNSATANYFKTTSTGNAARGARSALGVGGTVKVMSSGELTDHELLSGEYFEIHSIQGMRSGANSISGDFSFAATGYLCRNGEIISAVKGVTVSGNFHKMLLDIKLIGDTILSNNDKSFFAPRLRFEGISVAG